MENTQVPSVNHQYLSITDIYPRLLDYKPILNGPSLGLYLHLWFVTLLKVEGTATSQVQ